MIAVDTNILVYAYLDRSPWHSAALPALRELIEGTERWAIPWPCAHEFLSVVTNPRIYKLASPLPQALEALVHWNQRERLSLLSEGPGYFEVLSNLARQSRITGGQIHDARIAALCLHHGVRELWTCDRDFSRFPQLKVRNPLVGR
jgi:uncharacterized protein